MFNAGTLDVWGNPTYLRQGRPRWSHPLGQEDGASPVDDWRDDNYCYRGYGGAHSQLKSDIDPPPSKPYSEASVPSQGVPLNAALLPNRSNPKIVRRQG